jgi:O-antigen/teichoic acid export membrane protein
MRWLHHHSNLNNIAIYGFATAIAAMLTLIVTRVLWQTFSPADFGLWALIDPMLLPAASLLLLGIDHAIVKQLHVDKLSLHRITGTLLIGTLPITALGLLMVDLILSDIYHLSWTNALVITLAGEALILMTQTAFRATGAVTGFAVMLLSRNLLYLMALLLVSRAYSDQLSIGVTFATRGICVILVGLVAMMALRPVVRVDWTRYRDALYYGFPLLLSTFTYALTDMTDRWFLAEFSGVIVVGIYALHLKVAAILAQAIVVPFSLWFPPERFKHLDDSDGGRGFFVRVAITLAVICAFSCGNVWLARDVVMSLIAPGMAVSPLVLAFCLGAVICLAFSQALNVGLLTPGHTGKNAICSASAIGATVFAAIILVPRFGLYGAALSRLVGGLFFLIVTAAWSERVLAIGFPLYTLILYFALSIIVLPIIDKLSDHTLLGTGCVVATWTLLSAISGFLLWKLQNMSFVRSHSKA